MSLCELEQTGLFGWPDIIMGCICAFLCGGALVWWSLDRWHRIELLAARDIGRRERS